MKIVNNQKFFPVMKEILEEEKKVRVIVSGSSMVPFLVHGRDSVLLVKSISPFYKGDIVFYQRDNGQYVLHRIISKKNDGYLVAGDHQTILEYVRENQIFAMVEKVNRKGKWINRHNFCWWFFSKVWTRIIPLRRIMLKIFIDSNI